MGPPNFPSNVTKIIKEKDFHYLMIHSITNLHQYIQTEEDSIRVYIHVPHDNQWFQQSRFRSLALFLTIYLKTTSAAGLLQMLPKQTNSTEKGLVSVSEPVDGVKRPWKLLRETQKQERDCDPGRE